MYGSNFEMAGKSGTIFILIVALIVVLALIIAIRKKPERPPSLTSEARDEFARYLARNPGARDLEEKCSGVFDIANHPADFFAIELKEKEHSDVALSARSKGGLLDGDDMRRWIAENSSEWAAGKRECD